MSKRLFVGNVNPAVTEEELVEFFSDAGEVVAVSIPLDRETGTPRGFAFVEMATAEQAEQAMDALGDEVLGGRRIRLRLAYEDRRREQSGDHRSLARGVEPSGSNDVWGELPEGRELGRMDYSIGYRSRRRRRGKHGSDRIRGRGTRRFIE
jgi:RNA recognition motif-containing protein